MTQKLTLRKSDWLTDWYLIELAEHDDKTWLEPRAHGAALMHSGRFSDADVEGEKQEMLAIAAAIKARGSESFKRCAVRVNGEDVFFWSPRNSQRQGHTTLAIADELADYIIERLNNGEQQTIDLGDDSGTD
jgi:hypothetical protein